MKRFFSNFLLKNVFGPNVGSWVWGELTVLGGLTLLFVIGFILSDQNNDLFSIIM
jgi:hypothetical protein